MPKTSEPAAPPPTFESALAELEALVESMERSGLALEHTVTAYQRGSELIRICQQHLEEAREKLQIVDASGALKPLELSK